MKKLIYLFLTVLIVACSGDVEDLFENTYGVKVQIKDKSAKSLVDNDLTLGNASRL